MSEPYDIIWMDGKSVSIFADKIEVENHTEEPTRFDRNDFEHLLREMNRARDGHYQCGQCNPLNPIPECELCSGTGHYT